MPSDTASNSRIGSLVLDQTPKKNITFDSFAPFLSSKILIGKATYKGPAATVPSTNDRLLIDLAEEPEAPLVN